MSNVRAGQLAGVYSVIKIQLMPKATENQHIVGMRKNKISIATRRRELDVRNKFEPGLGSIPAWASLSTLFG